MDSISPVPIAFLLFIILLFVAQGYFRSRRTKQMKKLALDRGLAFLNWELPGGFPTNFLDGSVTWDKAHNVIGGMEGGTMLLAFDIEVGLGRQRHPHTVAAVRSNHLNNLPPHADPSFRIVEIGSWQIARNSSASGSRRMMRPKTIERAWNSMLS